MVTKETVIGRMAQLTGRRYSKLEAELSRLSPEALYDLMRFVADADIERDRAKRHAQLQPWRR